jgi:hypothetical protein
VLKNSPDICSMRDLIWTIIIIWVVFKIISLFKGTTVRKTFVYQKHEYHNNQHKPEGSVTVENKNNSAENSGKRSSADDEYVDFEEIK